MRFFRPLLVVSMVAGLLLSGGPASAAPREVTLRVAPVGFVVPSHWAAGNEAVWVVDPATNTALNDAPGVAGCTLSVEPGPDDQLDGAEVLDAASAAGCISGWEHGNDPSFGRFVTSVDGLDQVGWPATWWLIQVDGYGSGVGIDDMDLQDGQSLEFVYYAGPL